MYSMSIAHSVHFSSRLLDLNIFSVAVGSALVLNEVSGLNFRIYRKISAVYVALK